MEHPNQQRSGGQRTYVVEIDGYAWVVPFRDEGEQRVLITAYPSRRFTADYIEERFAVPARHQFDRSGRRPSQPAPLLDRFRTHCYSNPIEAVPLSREDA